MLRMVLVGGAANFRDRLLDAYSLLAITEFLLFQSYAGLTSDYGIWVALGQFMHLGPQGLSGRSRVD